jgi:2,3-bisphosphoglycerate-dependent phosphoglycerate mutase
MRIFFIRHGQTERNINGRHLIGQSSTEPLNETGRNQAKLLGQRLKKDGIVLQDVYSSPYSRALETCKIALGEAYTKENQPTINIAEELREYSTGEATGKNRGDVITMDVLSEMNELGMHFHYPGGESLFEVEKRTAHWLYSIIQQHKDTSANIAAFSHSMTLKCLIHYILNFDHRMVWRLDIENTSMSVFEYKLDHWFIKSINDTKHLG